MAVSGKSGSVAVTGVNYAFGKWSLSFSANDPDVTNFQSGGCAENVEGIHEATINLDGPFNINAMPLSRGQVYAFTLRVSIAYAFTVSARVNSIEPSQDVKDAARVRVVAKSTGVFVPSIL